MSVIDTETLFRSVGADGRGTSSGPADVGRFVESLRTFGIEAGLTYGEIGEAQQAFLKSYKVQYELSGGRSSTDGFEVATKFYQVNLDTIALRAAAERARRLPESSKEARTAKARVADLVEALKVTLDLPSRLTVRSARKETQQ